MNPSHDIVDAVRSVTQRKYEQPAGLGYRIIAELLDILILYFAMYFAPILWDHEFDSFTNTTTVYLNFYGFIISMGYLIVFEYLFQSTPGKMIFHMEVRKKNYEKAGFIHIIARNILKPIACSFFFISVFFIIFRKDKAAPHDLISKTAVIRSLTFK